MLAFDVDQQLVPPEYRLNHAKLSKLSRALAKHVPKFSQGQVAVSFVSDQDIRRLNRQYRSKDRVTDVLSFPAPEQDLSGLLGDVLIAFNQAQRQAEDGDIELEIADLLVHGILHLMGYNHEQPDEAHVMFPLQDKLVAEILWRP